jgi:sRNA-binding regulator protein Hfq
MDLWKAKARALAQLALDDDDVAIKTPSELKLLCAVTSGEVAYCGPNLEYDDPTNDPEHSEEWPTDRDVRGSLIRWLCGDAQAAKLIDPKGIQLLGARVVGETGSQLALDLESVVGPFPLGLLRCRVEGSIILRNAELPRMILSGSWIEELGGDGLKVKGDLFLRNGFHSDGEVRLLGADVGGDLNCRSGTFAREDGDALSADGIKITGNLFLSNGFRADGEVRLLAAEVGGVLDCGNGLFAPKFGNALSADRINVTGSIFLNNGFRAEGAVRLLGAQAGASLFFAGADLSSAGSLTMEGATVRRIFLRRSVTGVASAEGKTDISTSPEPSRLSETNFLLNLTNASVGSLTDDEKSWPAQSKLNLDGFRYEHISGSPTDADSRLRWIGLQREFRPQPYRHLAKYLRELGDDAGARKVLITMEAMRRELHSGRLRRFFNWSFYRTTRYGYEPWRAWKPSALLVLAGWLFFFLGFHAFYLSNGRVSSLMFPTDEKAYAQLTEMPPASAAWYAMFDSGPTPPAEYPAFYSLVYSLDTFVPVVNLSEKDKWAPSPKVSWWGWGLMVWRWVEIVAGYVLSGLALAGVTGLGIRKE